MYSAPSAGKRVQASHDRFFILQVFLIGRESGARFFSQSQSVKMQKAITKLLRHSIENCINQIHIPSHRLLFDLQSCSAYAFKKTQHLGRTERGYVLHGFKA